MIPCIVVPFLNRPDLLQRMVSSIDYPVANLLVVNNSNGFQSLHELKVPGCVHSWDEKVCENLGVAGSWDYGINYAFNVKSLEYVIIVGSDIQWAPGDLEKFHEAYSANRDADFMSGNWAFSTFALTKNGFGRIGWFDENIYPAYGEDVDFWYRCGLTPDFKAVSVDTNSIHGEAPTWGSSTIYSDPELKRKNDETHEKNLRYLEAKWKWDRNKPMGTSEFKRPFNDPSKQLWDWQLCKERMQQPHFRTRG